MTYEEFNKKFENRLNEPFVLQFDEFDESGEEPGKLQQEKELYDYYSSKKRVKKS